MDSNLRYRLSPTLSQQPLRKHRHFSSPEETLANESVEQYHGSCLNVKIRKEEAENNGSTVWSERIVKHANCVAQKRRE